MSNHERHKNDFFNSLLRECYGSAVPVPPWGVMRNFSVIDQQHYKEISCEKTSGRLLRQLAMTRLLCSINVAVFPLQLFNF